MNSAIIEQKNPGYHLLEYSADNDEDVFGAVFNVQNLRVENQSSTRRHRWQYSTWQASTILFEFVLTVIGIILPVR